jgi:CBS domain-containing protein
MTRDLITFSPNQPVMEVIETLVKHKISGGPVVDDNNQLLGVISEGDCIKQLNESRYYNMPIEDARVEKFMVKDVETIDGNLNIFDAANKFLQTKRRRFPILEDGKLIGQISQKDVMKAALQMNSQNWREDR